MHSTLPSTAAGFSLLCAFLMNVSCSSHAAEPPAKKMYATPDECFTAANEAWAKQDFTTYYGCLTPELQTSMVAGFLATPVHLEGKLHAAIAENGDLEAFQVLKEMLKSVRVPLKKHGIDFNQLPSPAEYLEKPSKDDPRFRQAVEKVADKQAFFVEFITAMVQVKLLDTQTSGILAGQLKQLEITGDTAKAIMVPDKLLGRRRQANFQKVDGSWLLHRE